MKIKNILLVLLLIVSTIGHAQNAVNDAAEAYSKGDFKKAITLYESLLKEGESAPLHYNLGNAYYKDGQNARAILNYEKSLLLNPGNGDARFNLELARTKVVDKIEPVGEFFLVSWKNSVQSQMSVREWAVMGIILFILFILFTVLFIFSRISWLKKVSFFVGILFFHFTLAANSFAYSLHKQLTNRNTAIILAPSVTVKSSPDNSGTDLFILHDGTKVEIRSKLSDWSEIQMENGSVGWLPSSSFEVI
ncbi:MAG: tetratricopeptide repeat protein [Bacteroidales bacterium]|jgi:tetratricopeptide (TPR) repeat protein|nr:tetratricopeptide repeat protein [Bacteroidales bacterium]